jgi:cyclopropane fatty-acyl-phospholipid synthase-like methyltransferase
MTSYRERLYKSYVDARESPIAPESIQGLNTRASALRRIIRRFFPENHNAVILDLGCGHGALVHFAHEAGFHHTSGVDRSPQQVEAARRLGISGVQEGDLVEALKSRADSSHDLIVAFDVIEHLTKDELVVLTDEVRRVLRVGGKWIIHAPNAESPMFGRIRYGDFTHEQAFTRGSISQFLLSSGFGDVVCEEDAPHPHGVMSLGRWLLWKAIRGVLRAYLAVETGSSERRGIFTQNLVAIATK